MYKLIYRVERFFFFFLAFWIQQLKLACWGATFCMKISHLVPSKKVSDVKVLSFVFYRKVSVII